MVYPCVPGRQAERCTLTAIGLDDPRIGLQIARLHLFPKRQGASMMTGAGAVTRCQSLACGRSVGRSGVALGSLWVYAP